MFMEKGEWEIGREEPIDDVFCVFADSVAICLMKFHEVGESSVYVFVIT